MWDLSIMRESIPFIQILIKYILLFILNNKLRIHLPFREKVNGMDSFDCYLDNSFKILMPYAAHVNDNTKEIFYVNRFYKYLGYKESDLKYIQYPDMHPFVLIHFYTHNYEGYPLNSKELMDSYKKQLLIFKDYKVIFSPEDPYKYNNPILLWNDVLKKNK